MVGFFKNSHILLFKKKLVFLQKNLAQLSYKHCFHNTFKVVNTFLSLFLYILHHPLARIMCSCARQRKV